MINTNDADEYLAFLKKFEVKKTTDDCYTPPRVYDAVADFVADYYGLDRKSFIRPFYPDGDFENEEYKPEAVVVDNPPFSILTKICRFYQKHNIKFFLFAPSLTLFSAASGEVNYLPANVTVLYENGARINTSFVTNLGEYKLDTVPGLYDAVAKAQEMEDKMLPVYDYPPEVILASRTPLKDMSKLNVSLKLRADEMVFVRQLDSQKKLKKVLFGSGFLVKTSALEAKQKAELEAKEAKQKAERTIIWELSDRENELIR